MCDCVGHPSRRGFLTTSAGVGLVATGAAQPAVAAADRPVPRADQVDPLDPVALAAALIRFETSQHGDGAHTEPYALFLDEIFRAAGMTTELVRTPKAGDTHLIARVRGAGQAKPLIFLGHSDVVPADRPRWSVDPFGGVVRGGWLYGRGALDMKGVNAAAATALLRHLKEGARFDRDIVYLADSDEEIGPYGAGWLVKQRPDLLAASAIVTEGGWNLAEPGSDQPWLFTITRQDRGAANLRLVGDGLTTHSSHPRPGSAIGRLARALDALEDLRLDTVLTDLTSQYWRGVAEHAPNPRLRAAVRSLLSAPAGPHREAAAARVVEASSFPWLHHSLLRPTLALVGLAAGDRLNVIPGTATGLVNLRMPPGGPSLSQLLPQVRAAVRDPKVSLGVLPIGGRSEAETIAAVDEYLRRPPSATGQVYTALAAAAGRVYPRAGVVSALFEAGTSSTVWREAGVPAYGVYPIPVDDDTVNRMHGDDERVRTDGIRRAADFFYRFFAGFRLPNSS